jgi:hypothetical protein
MSAAEGQAVDGDTYTVAQIREAFTRYAGCDDWGVPSFYEHSLVAALRGEYRTESASCGVGGPREASSDCVRDKDHLGEHRDGSGGAWPVAQSPRYTPAPGAPA